MPGTSPYLDGFFDLIVSRAGAAIAKTTRIDFASAFTVSLRGDGSISIGVNTYGALPAPFRSLTTIAGNDPRVSSGNSLGTVIVRNSTSADMTISGFDVFARGGLTSNDTDYFQIHLETAVQVGNSLSGVTVVGSLTTETSGSGGTGDWTNGQILPISISGGGALTVPAGSILIADLRMFGAGVTVPGFDMVAR